MDTLISFTILLAIFVWLSLAIFSTFKQFRFGLNLLLKRDVENQELEKISENCK